MDPKNKLVGRGLQDLFNEHNVDKLLDGEVILEIKLEEIKPNPYQPRKYFDQEKIDELASSIEEHGVFQPIILKKTPEGYLIVSGERRYRASKQVGLTRIPAVIRNYTDAKVAEISLAENLQREDLTPMEEAFAYDLMIRELKITQNELATKVGKSRSYVTNTIGLLRLPEEVQEMINKKNISMGHARTLSKLKDEATIIEYANKILNENLSVRAIEELTEDENKKTEIKKANLSNNYKEERNLLNKYYKAKVQIKNDRVILKVEDEEELKKLVELLIKNAISN